MYMHIITTIVMKNNIFLGQFPISKKERTKDSIRKIAEIMEKLSDSNFLSKKFSLFLFILNKPPIILSLHSSILVKVNYRENLVFYFLLNCLLFD